MEDDETAQSPKESRAVWPQPKFHFLLTCDAFELSFQEVAGLEVESGAIDNRDSDSKGFSTVKLPGLVKSGSLTLKNGIFSKENAFWGWFSKIEKNAIQRETLTISLLDESGTPTMTWTLKNAFPTKLTGTDLKTEGNEVAVESLEIAHEGLEISNG